MKIKTTPQATFCHTIKQEEDKSQTYCDIKNKWVPQYSGSTSMAVCYVISVFSFMVALHAICFMAKFKAGGLPIVKVLWSAIDVTLDVYTFYQLNIGKLLDPIIYRNIHVINGILVFSVFGGIAIFV